MKRYARVLDGTVSEVIEIVDEVDIADLTPEGYVWIPAAAEVRDGWLYQHGKLVPPATTPTDDQLRQAALGQRSMLIAQAATAIAPLQDAVDLGIATEAESAELVEWKRYRVLLLRVDEQKGFPKKVDWPTQPE